MLQDRASVPPRPGKLIHCIVEKGDGRLLGGDGFCLGMVSYRDVAAVVSDVEIRAWEKMGEEDLKRKVIWFQGVNIKLLQGHEMIPLRFGVIADDAQAIQGFLARAYLQVKSAFNKTRGRVEYLVQVGSNLNAMLRRIAEEEKLAVGGSQSVGRLRAIEVGKRLFEAAQAKRSALLEGIHRKLSMVSVDFAYGKVTDESTVMARSYLVEKGKEAAFDGAMEELGKEREAYLSFRYFGPLPAYSFVPLKFERANYDRIQEARNLLGLPQRASLKVIKASYRKLSLKHHPDRAPGCPEAEERFKRVAQAYATLNAYCRSTPASSETGADTPCSFAREDVERVFIVSEKG